MRVAVFSARRYDREGLQAANHAGHDLVFIEQTLTAETAPLAAGCAGVCLFVNDHADATALGILAQAGVRLVALRCAGFNNVDVAEAGRLGIAVTRVGEYSPHAVAEHAAALLMALNRNLATAHERVLVDNFSLDGLMGVDLYGKTVGIVGTGRIGLVFARIMQGFGCRLIGHDTVINPAFEALGGSYAGLHELAGASDAISLHCPLTSETRHLLDAAFFARCRSGALIVNTSRGPVIDTCAALQALREKRIGGLAMDVYEFEAGLFFEDHSGKGCGDALLASLRAMPNVLITGHQAFLTREAVDAICRITLANLSAYEAGLPLPNRIPE